MKLKILSFLFVLTLASCNSATETTSETKDESSNTSVVESSTNTSENTSKEGSDNQIDLIAEIITKGGAKAPEQIQIEQMLADLENKEVDEAWQKEALGHWVGNFGKNKINITITSMDKGVVTGYSVCAGNFRALNGSVIAEGSSYKYTLEEPGSDQYDGVFDFEISEGKLTGHWEPYEAKGNTAKDYHLAKREFKYDPTIGKYNASSELLTFEDVENYFEEEYGYMRNEIYARHGYSFKNKDWRRVFEKEDWYMPMGVDIREKLTDIEVKNIGLIYECESYYEEYYDDYGR